MANVHQGYRGLAAFSAITANSGYVRFSDGAISAKQTVNAPDLIMGDYDHNAYNYEKIEVNGNLSGPVTETFASSAGGVLQWACGRNNCGLLAPSDVDLYYYCDDGVVVGSGYRHQKFTGLFANSVTFTCTAGDVATWSMDVIGNAAATFDTTNAPSYTTSEKLITWDQTSLLLGTSDLNEEVPVAYQTFEFTVANGAEPVYAIKTGTQDLFAYEVVPGMRTITGSFTCFDIPNIPGALDWTTYAAGGEGNLTFNIGVTAVTLKCRFARVDPKIAVGPITSSVAFVGVTHQTGFPWDAV